MVRLQRGNKKIPVDTGSFAYFCVDTPGVPGFSLASAVDTLRILDGVSVTQNTLKIAEKKTQSTSGYVPYLFHLLLALLQQCEHWPRTSFGAEYRLYSS